MKFQQHVANMTDRLANVGQISKQVHLLDWSFRTEANDSCMWSVLEDIIQKSGTLNFLGHIQSDWDTWSKMHT